MHLKQANYLILVPLLLLLFALPTFAAETTLTSNVMKVTEGDTVVISPIEGGVSGVGYAVSMHPRRRNIASEAV